jgi:hypothetical protein
MRPTGRLLRQERFDKAQRERRKEIKARMNAPSVPFRLSFPHPFALSSSKCSSERARTQERFDKAQREREKKKERVLAAGV